MGQPVGGIVTVFTLFILCMCLSVVINILKLKYQKPKRVKKEPTEHIIYIDGNALKNASKKPSKKRVVPFEATVLSRGEFENLISKNASTKNK